MKEFEKFKFNIDNAVEHGDCSFISTISEIFKKRLNEVDTLIGTIMSVPLDYKVKEEMTYSKNIQKTVPKDITERDRRWRKWLKYETLKRIFTPRGEDDKPPVLDNTAFQKLEKPSKDDVKTFEQKKIRNV